MKRLILFFALLIMVAGGPPVSAHEKPKVVMASVRQAGNNVAFSVQGSQPFIVGNNVYVLHIGEASFIHGRQSKKGGKGFLTYYIPIADFNALNNGADIYLSYGSPGSSYNQGLEELSKKENFPCWSLGKFSRSLLDR